MPQCHTSGGIPWALVRATEPGQSLYRHTLMFSLYRKAGVVSTFKIEYFGFNN